MSIDWFNDSIAVDEWYAYYSAYTEYQQTYGRLPNENAVFMKYQIWRWLKMQQQLYNMGKLPQVFINLLDNVDNTWVDV